MDRSIGNFQIPAASLYAFFVVAIMITLAIYDRLIMPLMKKSRNSQELDFFTNNAPNGMKAITIGLCLTTTSFGMVFSTILVTIITNFTRRNGGHNWLPPSINDGSLDYFYWVLALLTLINFGFYIAYAIRFRPNSTEIVPEMNGAIDTHLEEENV
ncbi:protein nrt1/ ptr family 6.2 [Quercus suber]|uniref:Protein nrt1/ ptr family 6.2 n=1 Tax=Quercus suber TaxID=58331 RepID=A0AAW0KX78_QUESU